MTRIGDLAQGSRITSLLLDTQSRTRQAQAQISRGKVADRFEGLGAGVERLINVKGMLVQTRQYQENNQTTEKKLAVMEGAVASLFEIAARAQELTIQRLNSGSSVPGAIGPELEAMLDQAVAALNVRWDGRHLFAGSRTDTPPVVLDSTFSAFGSPDTTYYHGDALEQEVRVDREIALQAGMVADREGFQQLIGGLRALAVADTTDDRTMLEGALDLVKSSLANIADYQAELGSRQARLERINTQHADAEVYLQLRISEIEDIDVTEAISRLAQDQIVLESAMATMGRINRLSLADYL